MSTIVLKIANLNIRVYYQYNLFYELSKKYVLDNYNHVDIELNDIDNNKYLINNKPEVAEVLAILDCFAKHIYDYNMLLVHGAAIEYKNKAYLFMGPSGIGKSTHIKFWKQALDNITIINGDKPVIDDNGFVYGTPWSGKERWNSLVSYKLESLIFIYRDTYNHIEKTNGSDILQDLLNGINLPEYSAKCFDLVNKAFSGITIYKMFCTNHISAAKLCISEVVR